MLKISGLHSCIILKVHLVVDIVCIACSWVCVLRVFYREARRLNVEEVWARDHDLTTRLVYILNIKVDKIVSTVCRV